MKFQNYQNFYTNHFFKYQLRIWVNSYVKEKILNNTEN